MEALINREKIYVNKYLLLIAKDLFEIETFQQASLY
jgi:hypothetical protein